MMGGSTNAKHGRESTGFRAPNDEAEQGTEASSRPPLSAAWITEELLEETRRVWSEKLGRDVPADEAVEILMNVRRFAAALIKAMEGDQRQ